MNDIKLSARLQKVLDTASSYSSEKKRIIDVGSDHGHLAAVALTNKGFERALLTDIHEDPARKSRDLMKGIGLDERSEVICTDGLDGASLEDGDVVVMAGLGGNNMVDIIGRAMSVTGEELLKTVTWVLQPQKSIEILRSFLCESGFTIKDESVISERGIYYPIVATSYSGQKSVLSLYEKYYGPILIRKHEMEDETTKEYFIRLDHSYELRARGDREVKTMLEEVVR
ncbi:tRNA (adenine22-N1)-methyltransferase [Oscillospiraceae bacterium]|nr:tRNA (adenine22-N1)-methyltransferase [Oscillospiraceae bacterium]